MSLLLATHDLCRLHDPGQGHPERPDRLTAVLKGFEGAGIDDALSWIEATEAPRSLIERVHPGALLDSLEALCDAGGGSIDPDTFVSPDSYRAALRAAGAGLDLVAALDRGDAEVGWAVVRPPGHHALADTQMGFCLINNIAVTARALADRGERVAIVDIDAHHGNGTQAIFYDDPNVLFVSVHQFPWYPYTGRMDEVGEGEGEGTTINVPLPGYATGDVLRHAFDMVIAPAVERHKSTWLLISAGFDGHKADPLTDLGYSANDYAEVVANLLPLVPPSRRLLFLEGGYDLQALYDCTASVAGAAVGVDVVREPATDGGPGIEIVDAVRSLHFRY